ncbi:MAG TPA: diguanylate cyclase [Bacilli bacterium]|nr:diguanylate cyclase [Bacilli bacterium]
MKNKNKNKKKVLPIIIVIVVLLFIGATIYLYLNTEDSTTNLTVLEKQWIENNKTTLIDIEVVNNVAIIGNEGKGVAFDFINDFQTNTGLEFNKISINYPASNTDGNLAIKVVGSNEKILQDDLTLFYDNYLLIGSKLERITKKEDMIGHTIGILKQDSTVINNYFSGVANVSLKVYDDIEDIILAFGSDQISNMLLPNYVYLSSILKLPEKYVNYQISDIYNTIVIRMSDNNRLNDIVKKYYSKWQEYKLYQSYNNEVFDFYTTTSSVLDKEKNILSERVYRYGYVENAPYNINIDGNMYGIAAEYINMLSSMNNIEFKYIKYDDTKALQKALDKKEIDIAFINFTYNSNNYQKTNSQFEETVVGLSKKYLNATSMLGLNGYNLYTYQNTYIYESLANNNYDIKVLNKINGNIKNGIIIVDKYQYLYNINDKLKNYKLLFSEDIENDYTFVVSDNNTLLYSLFNFVNEYGNHENYKTMAMNNLDEITDLSHDYFYILKIAALIILIPLIAGAIIYKLRQTKKEKNIVKKEDRLKYTDMLTSLKNRNYLNDNMKKWGDMKVFPRTIVIVDLNNLKYVNDNYGYDAGNDLIVKAASVLINNQLEKSEIIRSDGNEFLIYLLGYSEKQVNNYTSKLQKELDKLPYGFGAAIGYSTISDEIKTIDDAINEATIEMRTNKEQGYNVNKE